MTIVMMMVMVCDGGDGDCGDGDCGDGDDDVRGWHMCEDSSLAHYQFL